MVTRRILEVIIITGVLMIPVTGTVRVWARKTTDTTQPGTLQHRVAEVALLAT